MVRDGMASRNLSINPAGQTWSPVWINRTGMVFSFHLVAVASAIGPWEALRLDEAIYRFGWYRESTLTDLSTFHDNRSGHHLFPESSIMRDYDHGLRQISQNTN